MGRLVDLSYELLAGEATYPWLPAPELTEHLTREASRERYAPGTSFVIHHVAFIGNSGTYLDAPFHRHEVGLDLADLPLERLADLPGIVIDVSNAGEREIKPAAIPAGSDVLRGRAVLFRTGRDRLWGTPEYWGGAPFIGEALAARLVEDCAALVGIEALNADDTDDAARPAHTLLLGAGIPIVENLRSLAKLPLTGFRFTAAPARFRGGSAFPVRAFAMLDEG